MPAALGRTVDTSWDGDLDAILPAKDIYHICHMAEAGRLERSHIGRHHFYRDGEPLLALFVSLTRSRLGLRREDIATPETAPSLGEIVKHLGRFICMRPGANAFSG